MAGPEEFISYAQHGEDVVLWRALGDIEDGHYVDVGASHPVLLSVTNALFQRGWRGVHIEPMPDMAHQLREQREDEKVIEAAVSTEPGPVVLHQFEGTGLSTLLDDVAEGHQADFEGTDIEVPTVRLDDVFSDTGWGEGGVHILKIDVEGAEKDVLDTLDLARWKPWVLVIEATRPLSDVLTSDEWEPRVLAAGYRRVYFDGISMFFVHADHEDRAFRLSYPPCHHDHFSTYQAKVHENEVWTRDRRIEALESDVAASAAEIELQRRRVSELVGEVMKWRGRLLESWNDRQGHSERSDQRVRALETELEATRNTVSWRITAPIRKVRGFTAGLGR